MQDKKTNIKKETQKKNGRPTKYTKEIANKICKLIATSPHGLQKLCNSHSWMPVKSTIFLWRFTHKEFSDQYAQAKLIQADLHAEECIDIADDTQSDIKINEKGQEVCNSEFILRSRVKIDTRKWLCTHLLPKTYGDYKRVQELETQNEALRKELIEFREKSDKKNKKEY